ncbi:MAG: pantoate--beta-alanine ligase [Desulfovibrio sp.]|jgi:pantoate--beta-alanine ligase|nr:pantoate--beta-alanine ligase [Desulfovibrio sp.]
MQLIASPRELVSTCRQWRRQDEDIALVPTMGYYHAGHEDLIRHARGLAKRLVVSLFVNPAQFGPGEDLTSYPRNAERDAAIARDLGADVLFAPEPADMYASDHATWVEVPDMAATMCGQRRPGHFRGVCTVVLKLFMLTGADVAVFGRKDWQQQAILTRMTRDLNVPVRIETRPTVREEDGLALSSRNVYLTREERAQAPEIYRGLCFARDMAAQGATDASLLRQSVLRRWAERLPLGRLDYLVVVDPVSLASVQEIRGPALMACAVRMGRARLIDNIELAQSPDR